MKFLVTPRSEFAGTFKVPGDKSISHRAVMFAAIAEGESRIQGFLEGEDCLATLQAFAAMGVQSERLENGDVVVQGVGKQGLKAPTGDLDIGNSGTSIRLLTGLLAGQAFRSCLRGDHSLMTRPMRRVCDPLALMGADLTTAESGTPPVEVRPVRQLQGIEYELPVASAQVKSAILLAGLYAEGETTVIESKATRDHTERMLQAFDYPIQKQGNRITLTGGHSWQGRRLQVPADISSAAFFIVAACIADHGEVVLPNVGLNPTRTGVLDILLAMNADIEIRQQQLVDGEPVATIVARASRLRGIDVPTELVPSAIDEFPIICIAAACAEGTTRITEAAELRVKESDRIAQVAKGLQTLGIEHEEFADGLSIVGGPIGGGRIDSASDHRIAMAFTVASLAAREPIEIIDCANVATSFPDFVALATDAGLSIEVCE